MAAERMIGIDFGTSTSVIRVKRYQDGKPVGDSGKLDTKEVIFGNQPTVPTVIQRVGDVTYYGQEALIPRKKAVTYEGFKINLESGDNEKRREARVLTEEFFTYLSKVYRQQSNGGHLGEPDDKEHTVISYPVKWSNQTKQFMCDAAAKAGFPHVEGMDEAQAAIHAVILQNEEYLRKKGYLIDRKPCTMLLIDMGAGTTDLVLCRYTPGDHPQNEVICTWPQKGETLFGGQEIEKILADHIREKLPEEEAGMIMKKLSSGSFKGWKENVVSPALAREEMAEDFGALESMIDILELDVDDYSISRENFESFAKGYLVGFPELVQGCIQKAGMKADDVELVILTGGHSRWYFAKEMLCGGMPDICGALLPGIKEDPGRVIPVSRPQETVALGLVYSPMTAEIVTREGSKEAEVKTPAEDPVNITKASDGSFCMYIEKTWESEGGTTAIYGKVKSGKIHLGDFVSITRQGRFVAASKIDRLADTEIERTSAKCGERIGLRLANVNSGTIQVGDLVLPDKPKQSQIEENVIAYYRSNAEKLIYDRLVMDGKDQVNEISLITSNGELELYSISGEVKKDDECREINAAAFAMNRHHGQILIRKDGSIAYNHDVNDVNHVMSGWTNIKDIFMSPSYQFYVGLKQDGTLVSMGKNKYRQCDVQQWKNVKLISCGYYHTAALTENGKVLAIGDNRNGQCNVSHWEDMIDIQCTNHCTVGLRKNGTVVIAGIKCGDCLVENWTDIEEICVSMANPHWKPRGDCLSIAGRKKTGEVLTTGVLKSANIWNTDSWSNVVSLSCHYERLLGLRADGTVLAIKDKNDKYGAGNVSAWKDIAVIFTSYYCTVGIKKDGSLIYTTFIDKNNDGKNIIKGEMEIREKNFIFV